MAAYQGGRSKNIEGVELYGCMAEGTLPPFSASATYLKKEVLLKRHSLPQRAGHISKCCATSVEKMRC